MICIFNASCFCTIGLCIVLTLLVCISSVFTESEEPLVEEKPVPNQDDVIYASQMHNKVFSNIVVKPVLFQLENSPNILKEMQENQLQIKVKHESKIETYIDPESMGLASLSGMRMTLTQKSISELTIVHSCKRIFNWNLIRNMLCGKDQEPTRNLKKDSLEAKT